MGAPQVYSQGVGGLVAAGDAMQDFLAERQAQAIYAQQMAQKMAQQQFENQIAVGHLGTEQETADATAQKSAQLGIPHFELMKNDHGVTVMRAFYENGATQDFTAPQHPGDVIHNAALPGGGTGDMIVDPTEIGAAFPTNPPPEYGEAPAPGGGPMVAVKQPGQPIYVPPTQMPMGGGSLALVPNLAGVRGFANTPAASVETQDASGNAVTQRVNPFALGSFKAKPVNTPLPPIANPDGSVVDSATGIQLKPPTPTWGESLLRNMAGRVPATAPPTKYAVGQVLVNQTTGQRAQVVGFKATGEPVFTAAPPVVTPAAVP